MVVAQFEFQTEPLPAISATATEASYFLAIHGWSLTRHAGCCDVASFSAGETRQAASLQRHLCARFFLNLLFDLRPGVFQRHSAVKHRMPRLGIPVDAKIAEALELIPTSDLRIRQ